MATRKTRNVSHASVGQPEGQPGVDKLRKRKELFIQQFEKEAQERINEMEAKLDKLLSTVDRAFKIEMMKLPQSLHTTLVKDLMNAQESSVGEVTMAIASASPDISRPLSRKPSKKVKDSNSTQQKSTGQIKTDEGTKRRAKKKMQSSSSTGNLRSASAISSTRTNGRVMKLSDQARCGEVSSSTGWTSCIGIISGPISYVLQINESLTQRRPLWERCSHDQDVSRGDAASV
uniref:Borealin N-terminal domain-containing protein n=1 Tax=Pygocentrus nattereri TaxID=42514 RepID=A0AAR2KM74_PYGNA